MALYAIYAPIIQDEFAKFVSLWNGHKIRTQKNRQHVISGIPTDLYHTQDVRNWGIPLGEDDNADDRVVFRTMLDSVQEIDIDSFLSEETNNWCTTQLFEMGFFNEELDNFQRPHITAYITLRQRIKQHQESGQFPILRMTDIPLGGLERYV